MLYIMYRDNYKTHTEEWKVGDEVPEIEAFKVQEIEADGNEARHIEEMMGATINRPNPRYFGDLARTIYLNL